MIKLRWVVAGLLSLGWFGLLAWSSASCAAGTLRGEVVDADDGRRLPVRLYIQGPQGGWFFARSSSPRGSAVEYRKQRGPNSVEMHTTLSADPFECELPPGAYTLTVERGKEYFPLETQVVVGDEPVQVRLKLQRWINMSQHGWYSGDTHVHRTLEELPNLLLAEDLNVAFPVTWWVTRAFEPPSRGDRNSGSQQATDLVQVDETHVFYPRNTEFEIFTVADRQHMLGAVFVLNHKRVLDFGVPPVAPIAALRTTEPDVLLELDKHNWPWSMALMPLLKVDLFELSNNHVWRTEFAFRNWAEPAPAYMGVAYDGTDAGTESGWIHFGMQNYYALLNCGFDLQPTAGTASGVHPVPLGFGRVYVRLEQGFDYDSWRRGLKQGRSFVTTGPMLLARLNGQDPGYRWRDRRPDEPPQARLVAEVRSAHPLSRIEIVRNGEVIETFKPQSAWAEGRGYTCQVEHTSRVEGSCWYVARCYESLPDGRTRFAHTAPWHFEVPGRPLRPRKVEIDYLIERVAAQIDRSRDLLPAEALGEYERALAAYRDLARDAR
ncbi:MAG: CehA/McbA family metallohydrolase [Pirellulaceae bacterium]|nr:CehA/McbA family metallohydrolase [Pirellulaceae bacterium]